MSTYPKPRKMHTDMLCVFPQRRGSRMFEWPYAYYAYVTACEDYPRTRDLYEDKVLLQTIRLHGKRGTSERHVYTAYVA